MKIRMTADSTCDLTPELIRKYEIGIAPLSVIIDGEVFHDHAFFHGKDYDVKVLTKSDQIVYDRATGASDLWIDFAFQVPVGFDGFFLGVYDSALLEPDQYAMELLTNEGAGTLIKGE